MNDVQEDHVDPIVLVPHDSAWREAFQRERRQLSAILNVSPKRIEHVGSTAIPGLRAKPVIDIIVGLSALVDTDAHIEEMTSVGYEYVAAYEADLPDRRYFRKPHTVPRTHHVHCVVVGSEFWCQYLLFRDYLRSQPEDAVKYEAIKEKLAIRHRFDRRAYLDGKSPFINSILQKAKLKEPLTQHRGNEGPK